MYNGDHALKMLVSELEPFSQELIAHRDELIEENLAECRTQRDSYAEKGDLEKCFFYEGSIQGLEECRKFNTFRDYTQEMRYLDSQKIDILPLKYLWQSKGKRTQIEHIYQHLVAYEVIKGGVKT